MELNEEDVIKFYEFLSRRDLTSPNIGVVGTNKKFRNYIKNILNRFKKLDCRIMKNADGTVYRIMYNDIEYCYVHIRHTYDLRGWTFRKFV